jgi:hypothetical protein
MALNRRLSFLADILIAPRRRHVLLVLSSIKEICLVAATQPLRRTLTRTTGGFNFHVLNLPARALTHLFLLSRFPRFLPLGYFD